MAEISFTVPLVPPSVNHYKKPRGRGKWYVTGEAQAFKDAVALFARGKRVIAKTYAVDILIYLGANAKGDIDNYAKVVLDGLKDAGVIHSDAAVTVLHMRKARCGPSAADHPRTEIYVWEPV
jgi:Holliday junction resolvase RusA-like endonuclease